VRRDYEMKANGRLLESSPVAIISKRQHRQEYRIFVPGQCACGQGAIWWPAFSRIFLPIRHIDDQGSACPYVGRRLLVYEKGEANILFVIGQLRKLQPDAD